MAFKAYSPIEPLSMSTGTTKFKSINMSNRVVKLESDSQYLLIL